MPGSSYSTRSVNDTRARVRAYVASLPIDARRAFNRLRATIRTAAPGAVEDFGYGIPAFKLDGKPLVHCAAWKKHLSLYPMTMSIRRAHAAAIKGYKTSKGTIQFPLDEPVPVTLVRKLVKARATEVRAKVAAAVRLRRGQ